MFSFRSEREDHVLDSQRSRRKVRGRKTMTRMSKDSSFFGISFAYSWL